MMCLPASIALAFAPASGGSVSYVGATGANYVASGTTISSPNTPAGVATGDGLFAIVFARSALTPPAGWTLVDSQLDSGSGFTQTIYIYRRDSAASGDSSTAFTWTQSASGRMGLAYVLARSSSGVIAIAETDSSATSVTGAGTLNAACPTLTATEAGELFILATSSATVNVSPTVTAWAAPSLSTLRTTASAADNRIAVATQERNAGQSNASPFTVGSFGASYTVYPTSITVRLQPA